MLVPPSPWRRVLVRERRLLLLCAASAAAHALVLGLLARSPIHLQKRAPPPSLAVTLHGGASAASAPLAGPPAAGDNVAGAPLPRPSPTRQAAAPARAEQPQPNAAPSIPGATRSGAGWDVRGDGSDTSAPHLPGMQAVQPPPSALLAYAVVQQASAGAPASDGGTAFLDWRTGDSGYRLSLGGAGSALGQIDSTGQMADAGFVPLETQTIDATVRFDWAAATATFSRGVPGTSASAMISADAQDRASMLMRLAAIGLGGAMQLERGIELQVAGGDVLATVVFEKVGSGEDTLATALGPLAVVHLRQKSQPGQACLEVWLAPQRNFYPVQIRLTGADGSVLTQTVTAIGPPPVQ